MIDFNKPCKGKILDDLFTEQIELAKDVQANEAFHNIVDRLFDSKQITAEECLVILAYGMHKYDCLLEFLNECDIVKLIF